MPCSAAAGEHQSMVEVRTQIADLASADHEEGCCPDKRLQCLWSVCPPWHCMQEAIQIRVPVGLLDHAAL